MKKISTIIVMTMYLGLTGCGMTEDLTKRCDGYLDALCDFTLGKDPERVEDIDTRVERLEALLGNNKGPKGDAGPKGIKGASGAQGPVGPQGIAGTNGANGKDGTNGKDGIDGTNGVNGIDGINGTDGKDGKGCSVEELEDYYAISCDDSEITIPKHDHEDDGKDKVYICHNDNTLKVSEKAAESHLENHDDDYEGKCDKD